MTEQIDSLVQEVVELAAGNDSRAIHSKGVEAKLALLEELDRLQLAVNILDGIVPYKAKGLPWVLGWVNPLGPALVAASSPTTTTALPAETGGRPTQEAFRKQRTARVLYLANEAVDSGRTTITTNEIARTLRKDGDTTVIGSLRTGIGNILSRTSTWKRVRQGEYEYQGNDEV